MRAEGICCDHCSAEVGDPDACVCIPGTVDDGWLKLVIAEVRLGKEEGFVNLIASPVVVDLCSPACAQAWATKLFETIFGKVEGKEETPTTEGESHE
jgi:hypothetical protein